MKIKYILIILVLAGAFLRLWKLDLVPPHLTPDEAALGYNAYSILKTGRDEYGTTLPIVFKSFGDYKPGLYIYAAVPFVALMGLNEWSVRLPSALFGILAIILIYSITARLFDSRRIGLLASFVLAFSPWHIHFSRGAWEINLALTLTLAGILFFLKSFRNSKYLIFASIFFASTFLAYQGAKLSTSIVVLSLVVTFLSQVRKLNIKVIITSCVLAFLIVLPIVSGLFFGQGGRLAVFSVFSNARPEKYLQDFLDQGSEKKGDLAYYAFHSENLNWTRGILGRWFNHYSGKFLFFEGDWANPRHTAPHHGVLLLSDIVTLLIGIYAFITIKNKRSSKYFIFLWLLFAPLSAALSRDQVHAVRTYNLVIPMTILIALGLNKIFQQSKLIKLSFIGLFIVSFIYFVDAYFVHLPAHQSKLWEYGYKQIVDAVIPIQDNYEQVIVQQSYAQPYIYFLFYGAVADPQKYDPEIYQKQSRLVVGHSALDVGLVERLGNIWFKYIDWSHERGQKGNLLVADTEKVPVIDSQNSEEFSILQTINYLNRKDIAFRIIEIKE